jgi:hypothetical protein
VRASRCAANHHPLSFREPLANKAIHAIQTRDQPTVIYRIPSVKLVILAALGASM